MPTSPEPMLAIARNKTVVLLYSNMATINPAAEGLSASRRASQQATPSANKAAPATRPRISLAGVSSDEPSKSITAADGHVISAKPAPASMTAVTTNKDFFIGSIHSVLYTA